LRGLDNVMLPAIYHKRMTRAEARQRSRELLEEIGYQGVLNRLPAFLSPQQRLQLAIARATILEPQVLFVEHPFANLSLAEQQPIYHYFLNNRGRRALVLASHHLQLARDIATQFLFIGERHILHFTDWQGLVDSSNAELGEFLSLYRQRYQLACEHG